MSVSTNGSGEGPNIEVIQAFTAVDVDLLDPIGRVQNNPAGSVLGHRVPADDRPNFAVDLHTGAGTGHGDRVVSLG